ncbi:MAG: hypothetical protein OWQ57_08495, partial [Sulfobacillus sp.]|nr:hypothetical protein [Sulfobacillus sp.]
MQWNSHDLVIHVRKGELGTVLKVHENDQLLGIKQNNGKSPGWKISDCQHVIQQVPPNQPWKLGDVVYWGANAQPSTIFGWSPETQQWVVHVRKPRHDRYELVDRDAIAVTPLEAQEKAWQREWDTID